MRVNKINGLWILSNPNNFYLDNSNSFVGIKLNSDKFFINKQTQYIIKIVASTITKFNRVPILIPSKISVEQINDLGFETIILTGGDDIDPRFSKTNSISFNENYLRDLNEIEIVEKFPGRIIGICRGLQIINIAFGGTLINNIKDHVLDNNIVPSISNAVYHTIKIKRGSMLRSFGSSLIVPSSHHQAIDKLGKGLKETAYTNNIIEAIESKALPIYGVQFHPEFSKELVYKVFSNLFSRDLNP